MLEPYFFVDRLSFSTTKFGLILNRVLIMFSKSPELLKNYSLAEMLVQAYRQTGTSETDHFLHQSHIPTGAHPKQLRCLKTAVANMPSEGTYLDVCAGAGYTARVLSQLGYKTYCLESDKIAGDWKRKFEGTNIELLSATIEEEIIPLDDNSVDCIYFGATLEHLQNSPRPIFQDFFRLLKPGATLIVDVPNFVCLRHRVLMLMGVNVLPSIDYVYNCDFHAEHHREYKLEEVIKVFEWSGFRVKEAYYDDVVTKRSIVKSGRLAHAREAGIDFYSSGTIWDYHQRFNVLSWFDWCKVFIRPLLALFPSLKDDIFVLGTKPD